MTTINKIFEFEIPGHATRQQWAVYVVIAKHSASNNRFLYVGKVGHNRDGCNSIVSRIGNHLSFTVRHSQIRNKLPEGSTTDFDFKIIYTYLGDYNPVNRSEKRKKIDQAERCLNIYIQSHIGEESKLLNPYKGRNVTRNRKNDRLKLLTFEEVELVESLAKRALAVSYFN